MPHHLTADDLLVEDLVGLDLLDQQQERHRASAPRDPKAWKAALALRIEIENFVRIYSHQYCALLTLILASSRRGHVISPDDAQKALRRAMRHLLPEHFRAYIVVQDFHRSGQIHFHVLAACRHDIRNGWNHDVDEQHRALQLKVKQEGRRMRPAEIVESRRLARHLTTSSETKAIWRALRRELPACGFRRDYPFELKLVRKPSGLASYLARRYQESRAARHLRPTHSQCVRYSHSYPRCVDKKLRISPVGPGARRYRLKKAAVGAAVGIHDIAEMIAVHGPRWEREFAFLLQPVNPATPDGFFGRQQAQLIKLAQYHGTYTGHWPLTPASHVDEAVPGTRHPARPATADLEASA